YTLRDPEGKVIDQTEKGVPLRYLHGHENIIPGLEQAIEVHAEGDEIETTVPPEQGYGHYRPELVQMIHRDQFQDIEALGPGMRFHAETDEGPIIVTITAVDGDQVTIDGNHELADQTLDFSVSITAVRKASASELEHGHVHDE